MKPVVLVHGGAGEIYDNELAKALTVGAIEAAKVGHECLQNGGSVLDALEAAVNVLEKNDKFNAGKGAVLNIEGNVELDAGIMRGEDLSFGGVAGIKDIMCPISVARLVLEKTPHSFLAGEGANMFAKDQGIPTLPPNALVTEQAKKLLEQFQLTKKGLFDIETVGAVAIDKNGKLGAATSTGGMDGKMIGRVSDVCIPGAGTYADDTVGAVSCTGHGESITKFCLSHTIILSMQNGATPECSLNSCIEQMRKKFNHQAGAIALSKDGEVGVAFISNRMPWAYQMGNEIHFGIDRNEHNVEKF